MAPIPICNANDQGEVFIDKLVHELHHRIGDWPQLDHLAQAFHDGNGYATIDCPSYQHSAGASEAQDQTACGEKRKATNDTTDTDHLCRKPFHQILILQLRGRLLTHKDLT